MEPARANRRRARVLVVSASDLAADPRVDRQIAALAEEFDVVAAGLGPTPRVTSFVALPTHEQLAAALPPLRRRPLRQMLATSRRLLLQRVAVIALVLRAIARPESARRSRLLDAAAFLTAQDEEWLRILREQQFDVMVVNDILLMPHAVRAAAGRPIVFDAHEYAPEEHADRKWRLTRRPYFLYLTRRWLPRATRMMCVSEGIAQLYSRDVGHLPVVVTNATRTYDLTPVRPRPGRISLVHWGIADPQRRLDLMIEAIRMLDDRFTADFILVGNNAEQERLRHIAQGDARIRFLPPVPMPEIPVFANRYDVGIYLLPPLQRNAELALPNKLFEFLQARLCVVIGPSVEMSRVVEKWRVGLVARDFTPGAFAEALRTLTPDAVWEFKRAADAASRVLNAEANADLIRAAVREAITDGLGAAP